MESGREYAAAEREEQTVYSNTIIYEMLNNINSASVTTNNLEAFKAFLDSNEEIAKYASAIQYTYDVEMPVYTTDAGGKIIKCDPMELMQAGIGANDSMSSAMSRYTMLAASRSGTRCSPVRMAASSALC